MRTLLRHRSELIQAATEHEQQMHKSLTQMNLQIHHVISDITGVTGLAIVDAILAGERDPAALAKLRDARIKADPDTIRKSLVGNWRTEHLFTLRQSRELYRTYQQRIVDCDLEIEQRLPKFEPRVGPGGKAVTARSKTKSSGTKEEKEKRPSESRIRPAYGGVQAFRSGRDTDPGLEENALPLLSEVGRDLTKWPSAGHFASWLNLCPDNDISGGKILWRGMRKVKNRAGRLFRLAASSLHHSPTPVGTYLRRMKAKLGPSAGITATAHKIAVIFYTMVRNQVEYDETIWAVRNAEREKAGSKTQATSQTAGLRTCPHPACRVT